MSEPNRQGLDVPQPGHIDLRDLGIDEAQAAEMRARLITFAEDWDSPEMEIYDDYDAARARSQTAAPTEITERCSGTAQPAQAGFVAAGP